MCRLCEESPEKADHIILRCPALNQLRWECFGAFQLAEPGDWQLSKLMRFLNDERVTSLEESVSESNAPDRTVDEDDPGG